MTEMSLDSLLPDLLAEYASPGSPGATLGVWRKGEQIACAGFGSASIEHGIPNGPETIFYIASTSKQFVAASIAMLEAEGQVDLDTELTTYLPEIHSFSPPVRVRHLVHHTSGIRDKYAIAAAGHLPLEVIASDASSLLLLSRQRTLNFEPGTQFLYSNSGYFLLAQIVERVSGQSLGEFTRSRIFEPLGMRHTMFRHDTSLVIPNRASGYRRGSDGQWHLEEYTLNSCGPGGVITTVGDLALWSEALMSGRLHPETVGSRMLEREPLTDGQPNHYAFGLMVEDHDGSLLVSHGGGVAGFAAEMIHVPDEQVTVVCLANSSAVPAQLFARRVLDHLLPAYARSGAGSAGAPTSSAGPLHPPVAGAYLAADETMAGRLEVSEEVWSLRVGETVIPLNAAEGALRTAQGVLLAFDPDGFTLVSPDGESGQRFLRLAADADDTWTTGANLVGQYHSEELGVSVTIEEADGAFTATWPNAPAVGLIARGPDLMAADDLLIRFLRGGDGAVPALQISVGRGLRNRFDRVGADLPTR